MAEKYIINMPLKTTPDDTDLMVIEDAQDTKRITWANVVKPIGDLVDTVDNTVAAHLDDTTTAHGLNNKANKAQPAFTSATLQNGWTGNLLYRKNEIGQIELRWRLTPGTAAQYTTIATLPTEFATSRTVPLQSSIGFGIVSEMALTWDGKIEIMASNVGNLTASRDGAAVIPF